MSLIACRRNTHRCERIEVVWSSYSHSKLCTRLQLKACILRLLFIFHGKVVTGTTVCKVSAVVDTSYDCMLTTERRLFGATENARTDITRLDHARPYNEGGHGNARLVSMFE